MAEKRHTSGTNGYASMSKDMVTAAKHWTVAFRDASWGPVMDAIAAVPQMAQGTLPALEMGRAAHDQWLDYWEIHTHEVIDHTFAAMEPRL